MISFRRELDLRHPSKGWATERMIEMRILKAGDPCPCCNRPIPDGLPGGAMLLLSYIAEGMAIRDTILTAKEGSADA